MRLFGGPDGNIQDKSKVLGKLLISLPTACDTYHTGKFSVPVKFCSAPFNGVSQIVEAEESRSEDRQKGTRISAPDS